MDHLFPDIQKALTLASPATNNRHVTGTGGLPSWFDVTGLAEASIGAAMSELAAWPHPDRPTDIRIDRALASHWFAMTLKPDGWALPPVWDAIAGLYETRDGWIRLHTNAPHHRTAALKVLDCAPERPLVTKAVAQWTGAQLETAIIETGGCAAQMRSSVDWASHPQGMAVAAEPLIHWTRHAYGPAGDHAVIPARPLAGIKVLDMTRVLAGPVATRFLAGWGADVLRIDPPGWAEANVEPEITLGKRCATLDLKTEDGLDHLKQLLTRADILVHGYRPDALERLGFGADMRRSLNPGLIDVSLCAYGWTGPWAGRRGFDSLVQMSSGIAHAGMERAGTGQPTPLPVQALDHATGYLMAAAALHGLRLKRETGDGVEARLSLARTAKLLSETLSEQHPAPLASEQSGDLMPDVERTNWGPARRVAFPATLASQSPHWPRPAGRLHRHAPDWSTA